MGAHDKGRVAFGTLKDARAAHLPFRRSACLLCGSPPDSKELPLLAQATAPGPSRAGPSGLFPEQPMSRPAIVLSRLDVERIENLLDRLPATESRQHESLRSELERAEVREPDEMPANVVTMNSTVTFREEGSGERI